VAWSRRAADKAIADDRVPSMATAELGDEVNEATLSG